MNREVCIPIVSQAMQDLDDENQILQRALL